jgi:hypothetical protein
MTKDICSHTIEVLPPEIRKDFQAYDTWFNGSWLPWRMLSRTREQLAKALECYRLIFTEWKTFYSTVDDRMKKAFKDRATRALEGMNDSDVTKRVVDLDKRYKTLCQPAPEADVHEQASRILLAFETTREQVAELALAYSKSQSDLAAAQTDSQRYGEFLALVGQPRELQVFLQQNFPKTWVGKADGRPLVKIVTEILTMLKDGKQVL